MIIDCISDLHGYTPKLQGGDLLLVAGDVTNGDRAEDFKAFIKWLEVQPYAKKVFIAGNHDNFLYEDFLKDENTLQYASNISYLCDSGTEFDGLKIWGSPWTKNFVGQNPLCKAFGLGLEIQLEEKFDFVPSDIDILITHSPPNGIFDAIRTDNVGSTSLRTKVQKLPKLQLHVFGHIHEGYGHQETNGIQFVNASFVNEYYDPIHQPIQIVIKDNG
ncbi:MAG: metallophosphoesterase [Parachlamydiaceae bacterium]|nr:metallophosphoesterase [Parachlamydiaceae bacterium]